MSLVFAAIKFRRSNFIKAIVLEHFMVFMFLYVFQNFELRAPYSVISLYPFCICTVLLVYCILYCTAFLLYIFSCINTSLHSLHICVWVCVWDDDEVLMNMLMLLNLGILDQRAFANLFQNLLWLVTCIIIYFWCHCLWIFLSK